MMRLLLDRVSDIESAEWDSAICQAVASCSIDLITLLIEKRKHLAVRSGTYGPLDAAVERENSSYPVVQALVRAGADSDLEDDDIRRLLTKALTFFSRHEGEPEWQGGLFSNTKILHDVFTTGPGRVVQYLLQRLPYEEASIAHYGVLLQMAAAAGQEHLIGVLIQHKVDVNAAGSYYGTALQAACRFGEREIVDILLKAGANSNIIQGRYQTALRAAALEGHTDIVALLLSAGAEIDLYMPSHYLYWKPEARAVEVAMSAKHSETAMTLIAAGAQLDIGDGNRQPLLIQACATGDAELVSSLLAAGAAVQVSGRKQPHDLYHPPEIGSAMHAAIHSGSIQIASLLLSSGFDLAIDFGEFGCPLALAARREDVAMVDYLLLSASAIRAEDLRQALQEAIQYSNVTVVKRLLHAQDVVFADSHAEIDQVQGAIRRGDPAILELLLEALSKSGRLVLASTGIMGTNILGNEEVCSVLLENLSCEPDFFVEACNRGYTKVLRTALDQGLSASTVDSDGRPAIYAAATKGHADIVNVLLEDAVDVTLHNPVYGPLIRATLEGCAAVKLSDRSLPEHVQNYVHTLRAHKKVEDAIPIFDPRCAADSRSHHSHGKLKCYERIVELLLDHDRSCISAAGTLGSPLSLAAFMGLRNSYDALIDHGADMSITGGVLHSPLQAALDGQQTMLARHIVLTSCNLEARSPAMNDALFTACDHLNLSAVAMLLRHGASSDIVNADGDTLLGMVLTKTAHAKRWPGEPAISTSPIIVQLLLDSSTILMITGEDLTMAAKIPDRDVRVNVLRKLISGSGDTLFPEDAFVLLLKERWRKPCESDMVMQILQDKRIPKITDRMLKAACDVDTVLKLLDYDASYTVSPATLDIVSADRATHVRDSIAAILQRVDLLVPSLQNVVRVLEHKRPVARGCWRNEREPSHVLHIMFSRNPALSTTESMLIASRSPDDLEVLLQHVDPGEDLVTPAVMSSLARKNHAGVIDMLWMLLKHDRTARVPRETIRHLVKRASLDDFKGLLAVEPEACLTEENILVVFRGICERSSRCKRMSLHRAFVALLRQHRDQWCFSDVIQEAVNAIFRTDSEPGFRDLYHSLEKEPCVDG